MLLRQGQHQRSLTCRLHRNFGGHPGRANEADVNRATVEEVEVEPRVTHRGFDRNLGIPSAELAHDLPLGTYVTVKQIRHPKLSGPARRVVGKVAKRAVLDLDEAVGVWQEHRERQGPQDREPHDGLASDAITDRSPGNRARHDADEEGDQIELRRLYRQVELVDQIEGVVRAQARAVHVLGKQQSHEDGHRLDDLPARQRALAWRRGGHHGGGRGPRARSRGRAARVPVPDLQQYEDGDQRHT